MSLFQDFLKSLNSVQRTPEIARTFFKRPEVQFHLSLHRLRTNTLNSTLDLLVRMHERNKKELGIPQAELDAAGQLLNKEDYEENSESIECKVLR